MLIDKDTQENLQKLDSIKIAISSLQSTFSKIDLSGITAVASKMAKIMDPIIKEYSNLFVTFTPMMRKYNELFEILKPQLSKLSEIASASYNYHFPSNWGDNTTDYVDLCKSGFPIIFIPNSKILDKVIKSKTFALKKTVLCKNDQTIINDCENAIKGCKCLNKDIKAHIISSILSYKNKNYRSAQSSATIVFDCLLEYIIDVKVIRKLQNNKKKLASNVVSKIKIIDFDKLSFSKVPFYTILMIPIINNALKLFAIGDKNTFVNEYNRHMSIHTVSSTQYKHSNALIAIMLITNICVITDKLGKNWLEKTLKTYNIKFV